MTNRLASQLLHFLAVSETAYPKEKTATRNFPGTARLALVIKPKEAN
jgi:hypothetical protein